MEKWEKWSDDFQRGRTNIGDAETSGPRNSAIVTENVQESAQKRFGRSQKRCCLKELTP